MKAFKLLLCDRFSFQAEKVTILSTKIELYEFKQSDKESLIAYYKRVTIHMQKIDARDRVVDANTFLIVLKVYILDTILRVFIKEISDSKIKKKTIKRMMTTNRSLTKIYQLAKKVRRTRVKIRKFKKKKIHLLKFVFFKEMIQNNLSSQQLKTFYTFYHNKDRQST